MQVDITVRFAAVKEVHRWAILRVLQLWYFLELEGEVLRGGYLLENLYYKLLIVEEGHIVQTSVIIDVPRLDEIL